MYVCIYTGERISGIASIAICDTKWPKIATKVRNASQPVMKNPCYNYLYRPY